jgi:hypothetical protein
LLLYSVDKRDRSRYSRPVGFDLQWDPRRGILIRSGAPTDRYRIARLRRHNNWSSGDEMRANRMAHQSSSSLTMINYQNLFKYNYLICRD